MNQFAVHSTINSGERLEFDRRNADVIHLTAKARHGAQQATISLSNSDLDSIIEVATAMKPAPKKWFAIYEGDKTRFFSYAGFNTKEEALSHVYDKGPQGLTPIAAVELPVLK